MSDWLTYDHLTWHLNSRWGGKISLCVDLRRMNLIQHTSFEGHVRHLFMDRTVSYNCVCHLLLWDFNSGWFCILYKFGFVWQVG